MENLIKTCINSRVPKAVVREFSKASSRSRLAVVSKIFMTTKPAEIHLITKSKNEEAAQVADVSSFDYSFGVDNSIYRYIFDLE